MAGDPRPRAAAKHCDWVVTRQPLEQLKEQAAVDEVILSSSNGDLLEGLSSNWFVVADKQCFSSISVNSQPTPDTRSTAAAHNSAALQRAGTAGLSASHGQASASNSCSRLADLMLMTTSPAHAALQGVTQQRVVAAAAATGLEVVLQPSRLHQCSAWQEAFLTNCLRGIHPVVAVLDAPGNVMWTRPAGSGAVVAQLQQTLRELQILTDMRQYL